VERTYEKCVTAKLKQHVFTLFQDEFQITCSDEKGNFSERLDPAKNHILITTNKDIRLGELYYLGITKLLDVSKEDEALYASDPSTSGTDSAPQGNKKA